MAKLTDEQELLPEEDRQYETTLCTRLGRSLICRCVRFICYRIWTYFISYRNLLLALVGGQVLSLLLCGTGVTSQSLEFYYSIAVPTTQLFLAYTALALMFFPPLAARKDFLTLLKDNWWKYLILGVIDVEANFLIVLAYKYTSLTSIQLLDSMTIVFVLILSFVFLRVRYLIVHLMGVAMCLIGIISLVLADLTTEREYSTGSNPFLGDLLCICGTLFYAISNVAQEYLVKNHSVLEWLGFIGFVGAFVSGIQLCIIDRHTLALIEWEYYSALVLVGFVIALVLFYILMPLVIRISSAAVINLSLLTADIFTFLFGVYLFKFSFSLLYVLSLVIIVVGIFIFNLKSPPVATPSTRLNKFREKLSHLRLPNSKNKMANGKEMNMKSTPNKSSQTNKEERSHILVRGPVEAALSSNTYSTHYSQSMSYGSNDNNNAQDKQH